MTLNKLILAGGVCLLFRNVTRPKKVSSDDYTGTIDTSYTDSMITENMTMAITTTEMNTITMTLT